MVTKFQLIDSEGKVLADGEIENGHLHLSCVFFRIL